jgi:hypothetical protein
MKFAAPAAFGLALAGALAASHLLARGEPGNAAQQIRLDRPVGGGSGGGGAAPAPAPPTGLVMDVSVEDTLRIMRGLKYTSISIEKGKESPYIKAVIDDQPTYIWHANCTENRCRALHFAAYLGRQDSVDDAFIHDYNRNTMFTKMAKDADGELQVTMGVSLIRGVSEEHIRTMGDSWITYFKEAIAYKPEGR